MEQTMKRAVIITFSISLFVIVSNTGFAQLSFLQDLANLRNQNAFLTAAYDKISIQKAWDAISDSGPDLSPVVVGIIDTGIDAGHPEFAGELIDSVIVGKVNLGNTPPDAKSDSEPGGHGTQVAGIIGANNLLGLGVNVSSDSPQMNGVISGLGGIDYILEVRKLKIKSLFNVILSMRSIHKSGGQIINLSFSEVKSSALTEAQKETIEGQVGSATFATHSAILNFFMSLYSDTLFVVAAGNENIDAENATPANVERDNVITVAATDLNDSRASFSNFGSVVDIAASGENVYAPKPGNDYDRPIEIGGVITGGFSGTSASAPMVTGVAGLIKAVKPELTPAEIKSILTKTENTDPVTTDPNKPIGRRLNAYKAICDPLVLNCAPPPPCVLSGTLNSDITLISGQTCAIQGTLTIPNGISLNVNPAVILKFASPDSKVIVNGTLNANGTASQPIYFTSIKDDSVGGDTNNDGSASTPAPHDWQPIVINSTGAANFNYSTIRYGSFDFYLYGGNLSLSHSHLTQNSGWSLYINSGIANITSSEIDHSYGGIVQGGGTVTVSQSSIHDNTSYGAFSNGPNIMNAQNNWWGDSTGPHHPTLNPSGLGNAVSDYVDFLPFLTSDPVGSLP